MTDRTEPYHETNREDSERACCRKCRYFHLPNCWCRRYPPVIVQLPNNSMVSYYPIVQPDGWCGEFRPHPKPASGGFRKFD